MTWPRWVAAVIAAAGAYYFLASAVLVTIKPFEFYLPQYGRLSYPSILMVLGLVTAVGTAGAAFVAQLYGGFRAVAAVSIVYALIALWAILPHVDDEHAWAPPPDIEGVTTATVLLLSYLVALIAVPLGALLAPRTVRDRVVPPPALLAAGAYYLVSVAMSLPSPQLDLRLAFPFTANHLPDVWHFAMLAVPALVAALFLPTARPVWHAALVGAVIGLAGAAPGEMPMVGLPRSPYVPTALMGVPLVTGVVAVGVVVAKRLVAPRSLAQVARSPWIAALLGAALALAGVASWAVLASAPSHYHQTAHIDAYRRSGDDRKIIACVTSGVGDQVLGSSARETETSVAVTVRLGSPVSWYARTLVGIPLPIIVELRQPLGSRIVVEGSTGQPVRETSNLLGPYGPWC